MKSRSSGVSADSDGLPLSNWSAVAIELRAYLRRSKNKCFSNATFPEIRA